MVELSSFFLELFLYSSPVAYWATTDLGSSSFQYHIFFPFPTVHGVLKARILKWFAIPLSRGPRFVRTLHQDLFVLGGPTQHGSVSLSWTRLWFMWSVWLVFCDCGFHSVCPLMEKDERLMEASWWEKWHHPYSRKGRRTKQPLDESERIKWKSWLKTQYSKNKIMESGPITSWEIDGETMESVTDFILGGSKITADGNCSHEIKRRLLLGRKAMASLNSILKSRDLTLLTKVHSVKAIVFPVVMYGCQSWIIKKAEHQRIDVLNCVGEDSWESLGLQEDPVSQS